MEVEEILLNEEEFCLSLFDLLLNLTYIFWKIRTNWIDLLKRCL